MMPRPTAWSLSDEGDDVAQLAAFLTILNVTVAIAVAAQADTQPSTRPARDYRLAADEVMRHIQSTFYLADQGLYAQSLQERHPEFMWGNGVMFSALVAAARHDSKSYMTITERFFASMDRYWDAKAKIPGYEPLPTRGGGNDKYYDDNAWMVLTFLEAYELTNDRRYLRRADETLAFVLSGWDEQAGGGIWWHEGHKDDSKNTCANAPAAVACLRLAKYQSPARAKELVNRARKIVEWTAKTFESKDGLFADSMNLKTGRVNRDQLTYNTALMIRAFLGLYRATGDESFLFRAKRSAKASNWFLDTKTHAYRDSVKWAHLLVEADLEMYRATREEYLLRRAMDNAEYEYAMFKRNPPDTLIDNASIARALWLTDDVQSDVGQKFWEHVDRP